MARTARIVHLPVAPGASTVEVVDTVVDHIRHGRLDDGDWLPSSRALAAQIGRSRGTVVRAYDELAAAGFVTTGHGSGTRVAPGARDAARAGARTRTDAPEVDPPPRDPAPRVGHRPARDLRPGTPDPDLVDAGQWSRAMRRAAARGLTGTNPWEQPSDALTRALRRHLRRHRGLSAEDPIPFDSSRSAIAAVCAVAGIETFHMEDPGYRGAHLMAREQGLEVVCHPADPDGLDPDALGERPAIVYLTPAHQYPLGYRMAVDRRAAMVRWARRTGSVILEDDYDGEFRYGVAPLPALATLPGAADHVVYIGTSSKSVSPDLRVAWCVPPADRAPDIRRWLALHRRGPSSLAAEALAAFIDTGGMDRHLARATRVYGHRRRVLRTAMEHHCPDLDVVGVEAGLHLCVLTPGHDDSVLAERLAASGWVLRTLSSQTIEHARSGLIINYARLTGVEAQAFARDLADAR